MNINICIYLSTHIYTHTHVHINTSMHAHTYIYTRTHMHINYTNINCTNLLTPDPILNMSEFVTGFTCVVHIFVSMF